MIRIQLSEAWTTLSTLFSLFGQRAIFLMRWTNGYWTFKDACGIALSSGVERQEETQGALEWAVLCCGAHAEWIVSIGAVISQISRADARGFISKFSFNG